jgi:hypothetical protein
MTIYDENRKYDDKKGGEYDPELVVDATPAVDNGPPIPPGHSRFYCEKCRAVRVTHNVFLLLINSANEHVCFIRTRFHEVTMSVPMDDHSWKTDFQFVLDDLREVSIKSFCHHTLCLTMLVFLLNIIILFHLFVLCS